MKTDIEQLVANCSSCLSEFGVRASANAHSRSYMSMHADPS